MKKSWLFLTLLSSALSVQAQFHTLAVHRPLYKVHDASERIETKNLPESGEANNPATHIQPIEEQAEITHSHWIERYLSVSYPLKQIKVTSSYGLRKDPFTGKRSRHNGLDLRARNEDVYAMMPGEVIKVSSDKRSGNYVVLRHGDYTVSYCHLSKSLVQKGAIVKPGEVVAVSGKTGRATDFHLHITVKCGKRHIDPTILLLFVKETQEEALTHLSGN